ncbi:TauD/TfdA family dioxygenase [Frankia sp. Ag45/Mut15]|uniref:TauD/TfdA family dioxygenase n=1 Tax=Frankia umida TaxID=573489 RepID=A0ABT0K207_9ACTN|nr:TauD/TfdA family dioxygenase [Frankia umida]MCK9877835.1 TauD/TfdA family dioxygenase [Frankia umida]
MQRQTWAPAEITPAGAGVAPSPAGLSHYLREAAQLGSLLVEHKALVFRGFAVEVGTLPQILDGLLPNRLAYVHGNSPRTKVGANVYTSTEFPSEFTISMHGELSYARAWPARLAFFCEVAPGSGGATPVVDAERWLHMLDPELRAAFAGGIRYSQNLPERHGLGKSWPDTYETTDRRQVEHYLVEAGAEWEWKADGGLRVHQLRPATVRHPVTGAEVWFNQADQWHPAGLGDEVAVALASLMTPDELPQSVSFADGTAIPGSYVHQIRDRGLAEAVDVPWQAGDLLLVDNVLIAHGRRPFTGARRVLVAMSG